MQNYFKLFDLTINFTLDKYRLESNYKEKIAQFHPDKFVNCSSLEKSQALQNTSLINTAYNTLKSQLSRAVYLLELNDINAFDEKDTQMNAIFLIQQIELREKLESISNADEIEDFIAKLTKFDKQYIAKIKQSFQTKNLLKVKNLVRELKFFHQLEIEANKLLDELL